MTDVLDRLVVPGEDLLRRVDRLLAGGGIPAGSEVVGLLERVGVLPGEVLEYGLRLDVGALREAARELAEVGERFRGLPERLSADIDDSGWEGSGAAAFQGVWGALAAHIGDGDSADSIVGRIDATSAYLEAVADWAGGFRYELAEAIARVISSAEAVTVVTAEHEGGGVEAAVRIAERVLRTAADGLGLADGLQRQWEERLGEMQFRPAQSPPGAGGVTRVAL
ncbi:WXG100 family type VII secretion target [Dactylosporangium sp. NPDC051541]|uniref:WXG100 family type VII secretion target n=1 Tax=Dactylosporangium sp. NPDC051541 TaxID=3363977 RepID=UPI0037BA1166